MGGRNYDVESKRSRDECWIVQIEGAIEYEWDGIAGIQNEIVKLKLELKKYEEQEGMNLKFKCSSDKFLVLFLLVVVVAYAVSGSGKGNRYGKGIFYLP